jgi:hypothetical protein
MARNFHIGIILSITGERLMSPTQPPISGVYEILNYMTGDNLYTHQLPRVCRECRPALLKQHPQLAAWVDDVTPENFCARLTDAVKQFGEELPVEKLAEADHERIDPLSELAEKVHPDKIIAVAI